MKSTQRQLTRTAIRPVSAVPLLFISLLVCGLVTLGAASATAQDVFAGPLLTPVKLTATPGGNVIVAETGTGNDDGRLSLLSNFGHRFNLITGLPSGLTPEGPSGPTGVVDQHATLFVLIGEGDVLEPSAPPLQVPNTAGLSSPIWSSLLRVVLEPVPDSIREGFALSADDVNQLADGRSVELTNDSGERATIDVLTDFRDLVPDPIVGVRQANPYAMAVRGSLTAEDRVELGLDHLGSQMADFYARTTPGSMAWQRLQQRTTIYVADAGMNTVSRVDAASGRSSVLTRLPPVENPLFPNLGGPVTEAVPTGVTFASNGDLLVSALTGFPFVPGLSTVWRIDPTSGAFAPEITGLTTVTDVMATAEGTYVAEVSTNLLEGAPGRLLFFAPGATEPEVVAPVLIGPTGITYQASRGRILVAETFTGLIRAMDR